MYEWGEAHENTKATTGAVKTPYKLNKKNFSLYKSSVLHTKLERRIPLALYAFAALLVVGLYLSFQIYGRVEELSSPIEPMADGGAGLPDTPLPLVSVSSIFERAPLVRFLPESAPAYSEIVEVSSFPRIGGCMQSPKKGCKCYIDAPVVIVADVDTAYCMAYLDNPVFNPYSDADSSSQAKPDVVR